MLTRACERCGTTFLRTAGAIKRVGRVFCGLACARAYNSGETSANWRGGHDPNRGPKWRALAETIRERDGYRCRLCGKTQEDNRQRLSVDHVVPWRTFDSAVEANQPSNLVSLCRSCHTKKTWRAEKQYLQGDVLAFWQYQIAVAQPWTKVG